MKEIFEQYGGVIIAVIAVAAIALIVALLLTSGNADGSGGGLVQSKFADLISGFFDKASSGI